MQFVSAEIKNLQLDTESNRSNIEGVVFLPAQHTVKASENTISFWVTFWCYILRQKLLHFALLLHFSSIGRTELNFFVGFK